MSVIADFLGQLATRANQLVCGLGGHDSLLHFESGRMSLLCTSCSHQTPGWNVAGSPLARRAEPIRAARPQGAVRRPRLIEMPVAREQRVA